MSTSSQPKKSLRELFSELGPEIREVIGNNEEISEAILASQMVWALIVKGIENKEVCLWAGENTALIVTMMPDQYAPLLEEIQLRMKEGQPTDLIAAKMRENSMVVWGDFTEGLVRGLCKKLKG